MKRRVLAMVLSMAMVFTMLPATTLHAEKSVASDTVRASDSGLGANLALSATAEAGYTNIYGPSPTKINDGTLANGDPASSWNSWGGPESGYPLPVTLTWSTPQTMSSMRVMWWAYNDGGVIFPTVATLEYKDGEEWKTLPNVGVEHGDVDGKDGVWNIVNFESPITTTALRMKVARGSQGDKGVGISEWEVYAGKIKEELTQAKILGSSKLVVDETLTYNGSTIPASLASQSSYKWSVDPANIAAIQGDANKDTVSLKGLKEGVAKLKLEATNEGVTKNTEFTINVREDKVKSIDIYKTSTAAGVAPILPDSVVANGIQFDDPTPSLKSSTKPDFDFAEEFNSKLIPVTWEKINPADYAKGKEGTTFRVNGTAKHGGKSYNAFAMITVRDAVSAAESNSSVTFENVQLNDVFWAPKQEVNAKSSLKKAISEIEQASGGEPNYDNAIKKLNGEADYGDFSGYVFQDSDIYKSIEAISYTLSATQDAKDPEMIETREFLAKKLNSWIEKIEKVQYADGYIDTFFTLRSQGYAGGGSPGSHRWLNFANHEMYNAGHFLEAVVAYTRYREGIGDPDYRLYVAGKRFADHIVATFGPAGTRHEVPGHEEIELAMVKFGKLAEEYEGQGAAQDYYDTIKVLIDRRGEDRTLRESGYKGGDYSQDERFFKDEVNAVGHSVRADYFYTGVTDIATLLPDGNAYREEYLDSLDTIWESVTNRKTYITGAIGTTAPGSSAEGYGPDYVLPPHQSYAEICASIASANWNQRMNLLHEDGKYADMIETNLYNSILVGTNLDGNRFYYSTLLEASNGNGRSSWFGCACCPPNLMRTIAAASGYMYTVHNDTVFVNMYAGSDGKVNVGGTQVNLKQETKYPWEGTVKMTVNPAASKEFTLKIRIPGWVNEQENKNVTIKVNNTAVTAKAKKGYIAITRTWNTNDVVDINMPMEVRKTESHPLVEATQGEIAIQRGPVVYCMEKAGNAQLNTNISNFNPLNFVIPRDAELKAEYKENLLNGVVEITGNVKYNDNGNLVDAKLQAIPYYAWNNRGDEAEYTPGLADPKNNSSKMLIWTTAMDAESGETDPDVSSDDGKPSIPAVNVPQLRSYATPTACEGYDAVGQGPNKFQDDTPGTFWNGWTAAGPQQDQWIQYDFGTKKVKLSGSTIDFYDDGGGVQVPAGIKIEYGTDTGWAEVTKKGADWTFQKIDDNTYRIESSFEEVETSKIRVTINHKKSGTNKIAVAVYDWKLTGDFAATEAEKKELTDQVTQVENILSSLKSEDYVEATWTALQEAITDAKTVMAKADANLISDVKTAQKAVADAYAKLDKKADAALVQGLQTIVNNYKAQEASYSAASWTEFKKALDAAEKAIKDGSGKSEINAAKKAVEAAAAKLDAKADTESVNNLKSAVAAYAGKEAEYTKASWAKFKPAFEEASRVANSNGPGQKEVDEAQSNLESVEPKLDKKAGTNVINELKTAINSYQETDYTPESWNRFVYTLNEVKAIAESEDPGEKMIKAAKTSLDSAKLKLVRAASSTSFDKLNQTIEAAKDYKEADYTPESWAVFSQALESAKNAVAGGDSSQAMVDEMQKMLQEAIDKLTKKNNNNNNKPTPTTVDKKALNTSITAAKAKKQIDYTSASWKKFKTALSAAQNVAKNTKATQAQVNTAKNNLDSAMRGLAKLKASSTKKVTLGVGETYSVKTKNCTYLSSNTKIATVNSKGSVKAKKTGSVTVKAIPKTGNKAKVFKITVKKAPKKITKVTFNKKTVKKNKVTLKKGKKGTFKVTLPKGTASKISYTSSKKKIATISSKGVVKAKKKGKTTITIKTFNKKTKKITLTVK